MGLQRTAGNAAVGRLAEFARLGVQRNVTETQVAYEAWVDIASMSFAELHSYAEQQADWHASPRLREDEVKTTRTILAFVREPNILDACRSVKVDDFRNFLKDRGPDVVRSSVRRFSQAVADQDPINMQPADNAIQALEFGAHLQRLRAGPVPDAVLRSAMPMAWFRKLVIKDLTDKLVAYYTTVHPTPIFQAQNGADVSSFLLMHGEGKNPISYAAAPLSGRVRNFHRFEAAALEQLKDNYSDTTKKRPLTLILHSALDHNGAFHRDPELTALITRPDILALMIEGKETLDQVEGEIPGLAATYGKNNKIDQVMIAGHGESHSVELAGKVTEAIETTAGHKHAGKQVLEETSNMLTLATPESQQRAEQLVKKLLEHMDKKEGFLAAGWRAVWSSPAPELQPHRRILMNACLANTTSVPIRELQGKDFDRAAAAVRNYLEKHPNLAGFVRGLAKGHDVTSLGANASVTGPGASADERAHLISATGHLTLEDPRDPKLAAVDKLEYVSEGTEPIGVVRALVECLATRGKEVTFKAMTDRIAVLAGKTGWREVTIRALFELIRDHYQTNIPMIMMLADIAHRLKQFALTTESCVSLFAEIGMDSGGFAGHTAKMLTALSSTAEWAGGTHVRLVGYQVWQRIDASKGTDLLDTLATTNCQAAQVYVDIAYLKADLPTLLGSSVTNPPEPGWLRLALLGVLSADADVKTLCLDYLRPLVVPDSDPRTFGATVAPRVNTALGGIGRGEREVARLALPPPSGAAPPPATDLEANVAAEGDSTNKLYVKSVTKTGRIVADPEVVLFERPDGAPTDVKLPKGREVFILGETRDDAWYAIEHGPRTRFVAKATVHVA